MAAALVGDILDVTSGQHLSRTQQAQETNAANSCLTPASLCTISGEVSSCLALVIAITALCTHISIPEARRPCFSEHDAAVCFLLPVVLLPPLWLASPRYVADLFQRLTEAEWKLSIARQRAVSWGYPTMVPLGKCDRGIQTQAGEIWAMGTGGLMQTTLQQLQQQLPQGHHHHHHQQQQQIQHIQLRKVEQGSTGDGIGGNDGSSRKDQMGGGGSSWENDRVGGSVNRGDGFSAAAEAEAAGLGASTNLLNSIPLVLNDPQQQGMMESMRGSSRSPVGVAGLKSIARVKPAFANHNPTTEAATAAAGGGGPSKAAGKGDAPSKLGGPSSSRGGNKGSDAASPRGSVFGCPGDTRSNPSDLSRWQDLAEHLLQSGAIPLLSGPACLALIARIYSAKAKKDAAALTSRCEPQPLLEFVAGFVKQPQLASGQVLKDQPIGGSSSSSRDNKKLGARTQAANAGADATSARSSLATAAVGIDEEMDEPAAAREPVAPPSSSAAAVLGALTSHEIALVQLVGSCKHHAAALPEVARFWQALQTSPRHPTTTSSSSSSSQSRHHNQLCAWSAGSRASDSCAHSAASAAGGGRPSSSEGRCQQGSTSSSTTSFPALVQPVGWSMPGSVSGGFRLDAGKRRPQLVPGLLMPGGLGQCLERLVGWPGVMPLLRWVAAGGFLEAVREDELGVALQDVQVRGGRGMESGDGDNLWNA